MVANVGVGLPKHEALLSLARAVGNRYRATGDCDFTIAAHAERDLIFVVAYYPEPVSGSRMLTIATPVTMAGWNAHVERQLVHEFVTVCEKRIAQEKFCEQYIEANVRRAADAYL